LGTYQRVAGYRVLHGCARTAVRGRMLVDSLAHGLFAGFVHRRFGPRAAKIMRANAIANNTVIASISHTLDRLRSRRRRNNLLFCCTDRRRPSLSRRTNSPSDDARAIVSISSTGGASRPARRGEVSRPCGNTGAMDAGSASGRDTSADLIRTRTTTGRQM